MNTFNKNILIMGLVTLALMSCFNNANIPRTACCHCSNPPQLLATIDDTLAITDTEFQAFINCHYLLENLKKTNSYEFNTRAEFLKSAFKKMLTNQLYAYHVKNSIILSFKKQIYKICNALRADADNSKTSFYLKDRKVNKSLVKYSFVNKTPSEIRIALLKHYGVNTDGIDQYCNTAQIQPPHTAIVKNS